VAFINTAYYLPVILGFTGIEVNQLWATCARWWSMPSCSSPVP
jgi:hypothetical protein